MYDLDMFVFVKKTYILAQGFEGICLFIPKQTNLKRYINSIMQV